MSNSILLMFFVNLASVVLKGISVTGTSAVSAFIDLLNDIGDVVGYGVLILGLRLKPGSSIEYPYGTRRALYVLGLVFIVLISLLLFLTAVAKTAALLSGEVLVVTKPYAIYAFTTALALNAYGLYVALVARLKSRNPATTSALIDALSDSVGSVVALAAMLTASGFVDTVGSIVVTVVILVSAATVAERYFHILVGRSPPKKILKNVMNAVLSIPEVKDVNVFNAAMITEDEYFLALEVEVDKNMDVEDLEKLSAQIEEEVRKAEPRFKHIVVEFVTEKGDKTYRKIMSEIDKLEE